jgi:RNA polymerase primary sigma factor
MKEKPKKSKKRRLQLRGLKELLAAGKEKGQLTYAEVNDILPEDVVSSEEIDEILTILGEENIKIVDAHQEVKKEPESEEGEVAAEEEDAPSAAVAEPQKEETEAPVKLEQVDDPVRMYC